MSRSVAISKKTLKKVIAMLEKHLRKNGLKMPPGKKARAILIICEKGAGYASF